MENSINFNSFVFPSFSHVHYNLGDKRSISQLCFAEERVLYEGGAAYRTLKQDFHDFFTSEVTDVYDVIKAALAATRLKEAGIDSALQTFELYFNNLDDDHRREFYDALDEFADRLHPDEDGFDFFTIDTLFAFDTKYGFRGMMCGPVHTKTAKLFIDKDDSPTEEAELFSGENATFIWDQTNAKKLPNEAKVVVGALRLWFNPKRVGDATLFDDLVSTPRDRNIVSSLALAYYWAELQLFGDGNK